MKTPSDDGAADVSRVGQDMSPPADREALEFLLSALDSCPENGDLELLVASCGERDWHPLRDSRPGAVRRPSPADPAGEEVEPVVGRRQSGDHEQVEAAREERGRAAPQQEERGSRAHASTRKEHHQKDVPEEGSTATLWEAEAPAR